MNNPPSDLPTLRAVAGVSNMNLEIFEAAPSGMVLVDIQQDDMPIVYVNAAFENITGYRRDEILGQNCRFLQRGDTHQEQLDILRTAIRNETDCVIMLRNYRRDGSLFWNELRIAPIRNPQGDVTHYIGITNDVSRRIQAEHYLQGVMNSSLNGITAFRSVRDPHGKIIDFEWVLINSQAAAIIGRPQSELVGKRLLQEMPGHREVGLFDLYVQVVESGEPLNYTHYYDYEQVKAWFQITAVKLDDGFVVTFADINDQKHLQQTLEEKHAELERYFALDPDMVCIADMDGNLIKTNPAWETILGYRADELEGQRFLDLVHPDDLPATLKAIASLQQQEPIQNFTNRYRTKAGHYRFIEWRAQPQGRYIYAAAQDVTDHLEMEAALRESEEQLRTIVQNIPVMIAVYDENGRFQFANQHWLHRLGWTIDELKQQPDHLALMYPDAAYRQQVLDYMLSGEKGWRDFETYTKDGTIIHTSWANVRLSDGRSIGIGKDITQRKHLEQALRKSESHQKMTLTGIGAGTWEWVIETGETIINERWAEMLGYTVAEIAPVSIQTWIELVHPEDLQHIYDCLIQHFQDQTEYYQCEYRMKHKNGQWVWISDRGKVMQWTESYQPLRMFGTHLDITGQKQSQAHEFEIALEKARIQMLTQFIQNAAHEFRTPLSVINSSTYMMAKSETADKRQEYAARIQNQITRTTRLVDMLSKMVELEGKRTVSQQPLDIRGVLEAVCTDLQAADKRPIIQCNLPAYLPFIQGDAEDLYEAFRQILDNARKYTPAEGRITIHSHVKNGELVVEIADSGSGISEMALPHIFETFWREDEAHTLPGFGLGLAIAQKIIQMHGGHIQVESALKQGTVFRIYLPLAH